MPEQTAVESATVHWIVFPRNAAKLRRVVLRSGNRGLLLQFDGSEEGSRIRERALEFGFVEAGKSGALKLFPQVAGNFNFSPGLLADRLGGSVVEIPRPQWKAAPWTIDYGARMQANPGPDVASAESLGLNSRGEEVFRDSDHRYRKIEREGRHSFERESPDANPALFLRAKNRDGLELIAAGLVQMATRGTLSGDTLSSVAEYALENCEEKGLSPGIAIHDLRVHMYRQIASIAINDQGSRQNFHRAMRTAENAAGAMRQDGAESEFQPSIALAVFLRRLAREAKEVDFSGGEFLEAAAPSLRNNIDPSFQLHDLTAVPAESLTERIGLVLGRRSADGLSNFMFTGSPGGEAEDALRHAIGKIYAIESIAEISPVAASGRQEGRFITFYVVGQRRPAPEPSLPQAALRTFQVVTNADFDSLHLEILRSRQRIRKWHLDIADEELLADDDRRENERQRPYVPLSKATPSFTMVPKALEGATAKSLRRASIEADAVGGVDGALSGALGIAADQLSDILTSEQVDAVSMWQAARARDRGFLLADQTGIGKGRSLAAMARLQLRSGGKVLYFTESADVNVIDVWRDLLAVGADREAKPCVLATRPVELFAKEPPRGTESGAKAVDAPYRTESSASRNRIFSAGTWPEDRNLVLTTYSQFNSKSNEKITWLREAVDDSALVVLDEAHNAVNPMSNTGKAIRELIENVGRSNVVFATATPLRNPAGADLYRPLLPNTEGSRLDEIFSCLSSGGETAQESFTTMLAEDGVFLRRDHDLSHVDYQVRLPGDSRMAAYQDLMDRMSPVVEQMLDISIRVGRMVGQRQARMFHAMIENGVEPNAARARTNAANQYSGHGGPIPRLARTMINATKVDQVVEEALAEFREGRKPVITFHSTGAGLFNEQARLADDEGFLPGDRRLTLADQIWRVAESVFRIKVDGEAADAREINETVAEMAETLSRNIAEIPDGLLASPVDGVIEGLRKSGLLVGEISGRVHCYRDGRIERRGGTDRRSTIDAFNNGGLDALIFNVAGATGASYHASPLFQDRRPRSLIEMETPTDIIKYVQSQGRVNRYGQVARPRVVSVMTGLTPEMRILQQRNSKLRMMGASIDGNRSHPLLVDEVPDLLNHLGDQATAQVLEVRPDFARRLGFSDLLSGELDHGHASELSDHGSWTDSGASRKSILSLANRVLCRSLVLSASEQSELVNLVQMEFEAISEELDSRNANPLRPKELDGEIEFDATTLYSGIETDDEQRSAFLAPLYISTGTHRFSEAPISADQLVQLVQRAKVRDGSDGFASRAEPLENQMSTLLRDAVRPGTSIEQALASPGEQSARFRHRMTRLKNLARLLRDAIPGRKIEYVENAGIGPVSGTITRVSAKEAQYASLPQSYHLEFVRPGFSKPFKISFQRLVALPKESIVFSEGLEHGPNQRHLAEFGEQLAMEIRYPVQVLTGNHLTAIAEANRYSLGSMSLFRDSSSRVHRGIVVNRSKLDLTMLPAIVPSGRVAAALALKSLNEDIRESVYLWTGERAFPEMLFVVGSQSKSGKRGLLFRAPKFRNGAENVLKSNPMLCDALFGCAPEDVQARLIRRTGPLYFPENQSRISAAFHSLDGIRLYADGKHRNVVNELIRDIEALNAVDAIPPSPAQEATMNPGVELAASPV
ncbi:MAG: strawberry notch C-terminal domain-containing protein [Albidovulum sp.]|nr:strawberry notch C-terminal domain-containing protein [Albidovulum sp.]